MSNNKRIILVTELFFPEESATAHIMTQIANYLSLDFDVLVLAGPDSYEGDIHRLVANHGNLAKIKIQRAWAPRLSKNNLASRLIRFIILSTGIAWMVLTRSRRDDIVFAVTNPAPLLVLLAPIRKLKKFSLILLVHDVFPENAVAAGIASKNTFLYRSIKWVFDRAYGAADAIITIGRDMAEVIAIKIRGNPGRISIIENWADLSLINSVPREDSKIKTWGLSEKVVIQYAGNIGRAQGILEFVDAVRSVNNNLIHYVFVGSGALSESLKTKVEDCDNFTLEGAYSRADQSLVLSSCDIALVILGAGMYGLGVPSKAYNLMAAGKPILFLGPKNSEIYRLIKEHNIGWAFDWQQVEELNSFLNSISSANVDNFCEMGRRARSLAEQKYSEVIQMQKFRKVIYSLCNL